MKSIAVCTTSKEAYELFDDLEWAGLLRRNGVDISRPIRYHVGITAVFVYYDDTFIKEGI